MSSIGSREGRIVCVDVSASAGLSMLSGPVGEGLVWNV